LIRLRLVFIGSCRKCISIADLTVERQLARRARKSSTASAVKTISNAIGGYDKDPSEGGQKRFIVRRFALGANGLMLAARALNCLREQECRCVFCCGAASSISCRWWRWQWR
jgi:hypothetical protein